MTLELLTLIGLAAVIAAFFGGRASASGRAEIRRLQAEVDGLRRDQEALSAKAAADLAEAEEEAAAKAAAVEAGVTNHFEQSAALFGKLALDYRAFLEHFSESAQRLGLSETHARELIDQVAHPLLGHDPALDDEMRVAEAQGKKPDTATDLKPAAESEQAKGAPPKEARETKARDTKKAAKAAAKPPTLDPISAKVAEIELEEAQAAPAAGAGAGNTPAKSGAGNTPAKSGAGNTPAKSGAGNTPAKAGNKTAKAGTADLKSV